MNLMPINLEKGHTVYKNAAGKRVPNVTTVIEALANPALYSWNNRMGLAGVDTSKYVAHVADIGTVAHARVHAFLLGYDGIDESSLNDETITKSLTAFERFADWWGGEGLAFEAGELRMVSSGLLEVGGTLDILAHDKDGDRTLIDLKTSDSGIYPRHLLQTVAYGDIVSQDHLELDDSGKLPTWNPAPARAVRDLLVLRIGRESDDVFEPRPISRYERARMSEAFWGLVQLRPTLLKAGVLR